MKIAVRMDDITPGMDWERFEAFKQLLDEYQIRPLIGVVPDNRDENLNRMEKERSSRALRCLLERSGAGESEGDEIQLFWQYIRRLQAEGWSVALHGCRHLYTKRQGGLFPLNRLSEFAGVSYEEQRRMIAAGRQILEAHGIQAELFMAPAHSYDRNTLRALREEGLHRITDGFGSRPYARKGITFYPISFRLESSLKKKRGITTMVVHTNTMSEQELLKYRRIFQRGEVISYREYLREAAVPRGLPGCMAEYTLACIKRILVRLL